MPHPSLIVNHTPRKVCCLRVVGRKNHNKAIIMKEIITQLIAASIDKEKIPSLDCFDMSDRHHGIIRIHLDDSTVIQLNVEILP